MTNLSEGGSLRCIQFGWQGPASLESALTRPFCKISAVIPHPAWGPHIVTLWGIDGRGLRISSQMHDLAERIEVGVLRFEWITESTFDEVLIDLGQRFVGAISASKLVIEESGVLAESGIVLTSSSGEEVVIVASAGPFALSVKGIDAFGPFEPEYDLSDYRRNVISK